MKKNIKKWISIVLTVALMVTSLGVSSSAASLRKLDLAFVIDTTGSMEDDIYQVKCDMIDYLADLSESGMNFRIAIVDYRDFPERAASTDYPYKVQLDFTDDYDAITYSIESLSTGNGGDEEETICSALIDGLSELSWRNEAGKAAILMGDAGPLDPEPYTNYTMDMAVSKLLYNNIGYSGDVTKAKSSMQKMSVGAQDDSRSSVTLFTIATSYRAVDSFEYLAEETGGKSYVADGTEEISEIISDIIEVIPETVEDNSMSFFDVIARIFLVIFYIVTFQWSKI